MRLTLQLVLPLLVLALQAGALSWDEERLQWLLVTKPGEQPVQLNCTSQHIYPFTLLNDSSVIGAVGSYVKRIWWILPDGNIANGSYDDANRRLVDNGVGLWVRYVDDNVNGLYHCAVEAVTRINETMYNHNRTTVYYYKRGLNLYGMDIYGGSAWEKYKRNTLIGSLTAGIFLALVAGYAVLDRLGVWAKCTSRSNTVDFIGSSAVVGGGAGGGGVEEFKTDGAAELADAKSPPPAASPVEHSRASVRSRRSEPPQAQETAA